MSGVGVAGVLALGAALTACSAGTAGPSPSASPSASASTAPTAATPTAAPVPPLAVVVRLQPDRGGGWIGDGTSWDVELHRIDGSRAAAVHATHAAAADLFDALPLSASATAVYFLDGATTLRRMTAAGAVSVATSLPAAAPSQTVVFAVSPDDTRIAVAVLQLQGHSGPIHETLTVRALGGGGQRTLADFTAHITGPGGSMDRLLLRPLGWHGDTLVVRSAAPVQNSPNGLVSPLGQIALYDTTTGAAVPSPCDHPDDDAHPQVAGIVCDGALRRWDGSRLALPSGGTDTWVSPDGTQVAGTLQDGHVGFAAAGASALTASTASGLVAGWMDSSHLAVQDVQPTPGRGSILTSSGGAVRAGPSLDGYVVETVPALLR